MKKIFYSGKHAEAASPSLLRLMLPSVLVLVFSMVFFLSMTWAWFEASVSVEAGTVRAAAYYIDELAITKYEFAAETPAEADGENAEAPAAEPEVSYVESSSPVSGNPFYADANVKYEITLKTGGTASGYCKVTTPDGTYYIYDSAVTFSMILGNAGTVTLAASWGAAPDSAPILSDGETIGTGHYEAPAPEETPANDSAEEPAAVEEPIEEPVPTEETE